VFGGFSRKNGIRDVISTLDSLLFMENQKNIDMYRENGIEVTIFIRKVIIFF